MLQRKNHEVNAQHLDDSDFIISKALRCLEERLHYSSELINHSEYATAYVKLQLAGERNEVFGVLFLNNKKCLIAFEKLFQGTINEANVYPRVVVQKALELNAASIILVHNHPSGDCNPSQHDIQITQELKKILKIVDVEVVDHIIVSGQNSYSFAENNLM